MSKQEKETKMHIFCSAVLSVIILAGVCTAKQTVLIEAEGFEDLGGWVIDQQFMD